MMSLNAIGQNVMSPELLWKLGRVTPLGISKDAKNVVFKVSTPSIEENKSTSKIYTIPVTGGNAVEIKDTKEILADKNISPDGKFLYASNRGEANTISIFKIQKNGQLQPQSVVSSLGKGPRNFAIDPTGKFLLVAHQYSNDVVIFKRDAVSGAITDSGKRLKLCSPVCLIFGN